MRADPVPQNAAGMVLPERPIAQAHAGRPYAANLLKTDGRVPWVFLEELEAFVGKRPHVLWQLPVAQPEGR